MLHPLSNLLSPLLLKTLWTQPIKLTLVTITFIYLFFSAEASII